MGLENLGTEEITCPHCKYEFSDSWEFKDNHDKIECPECYETFYYYRDIEVTYSTFRK